MHKLLTMFFVFFLCNLFAVPQAKIIFLDGIPASGKSTISKELVNLMRINGVNAYLIESDEIALSLASSDSDKISQNKPFWANGVLLAIEQAKKMANENALIILDAFLWKELYEHLAPDEFYYVLIYAPLEVVQYRFAQRNFCNEKSISQERLSYLAKDFFSVYFMHSHSEKQYIASYNEQENLYAYRNYDLILHSHRHLSEILAQQIFSSFHLEQ